MRARSSRRKNPSKCYELDAIAYPGNSGSPVWHPDTGEVLGVVNSVYVKGAKEAALSTPSGISYAIPVKYVRALLEQAFRRKMREAYMPSIRLTPTPNDCCCGCSRSAIHRSH